jgi:hypothetical protein
MRYLCLLIPEQAKKKRKSTTITRTMLKDAGYDLSVIDRLAPRLAEYIFSGEDPWVYKWSAEVALKFANYVSVHLQNPAYGAHLTENSILSGFVSISNVSR